jgi:subtilase family serine protease
MKICQEMESNNTLQVGTASGTLLSIVPSIASEDIIKTIILAVVGAIISFAVSLLLKWFTKNKNK